MSKKVLPLYNSTNMFNTDEFPAPERSAALKRNRRMRSNQGQLGAAIRKKGKDGHTAHITTDEAEALEDCGASAFLIKTYEMISTCNTDLAEWSDDGETFVVKNSSKFAQQEIPKFFDHKNFASFSRQLNFYGFRKVPHKIIRIDKQHDKQSSRYVRFQNEYFKRGRIDLLKRIRRSTKNAGVAQNQVQEVTDLKTKVSSLETQVTTMSREIELLQKQVRKLLYNSGPSPTKYSQIENPSELDVTPQVKQEYYEYESTNGGLPPSSRDVFNEQVPSMGFVDSTGNQNQAVNANQMNAITPPTLAPHPNTKQLDPNDLPRPSSSDYSIRELSIGFIEMNFELNETFAEDTGSSYNENHVNNVEV